VSPSQYRAKDEERCAYLAGVGEEANFLEVDEILVLRDSLTLLNAVYNPGDAHNKWLGITQEPVLTSATLPGSKGTENSLKPINGALHPVLVHDMRTALAHPLQDLHDTINTLNP